MTTPDHAVVAPMDDDEYEQLRIEDALGTIMLRLAPIEDAA